MRRYLRNIIIWFFDIGFNVLFLAGSPYETISSRVQKRIEHGDKWAVNFMGPFICWLANDPDHCIKARIPDDIITNAPNWWRF